MMDNHIVFLGLPFLPDVVVKIVKWLFSKIVKWLVSRKEEKKTEVSRVNEPSSRIEKIADKLGIENCKNTVIVVIRNNTGTLNFGDNCNVIAPPNNTT